MDLSLIMFFVILNILILLLPSMCLLQGISTPSSINQLQLSSQITVPKLILSKELNLLIPSTIRLTTNSFQARRQAARNFSNHRGRVARRGLVPSITNFASNTIGGLLGNSNTNLPTLQPDLAALDARQATAPYPQEFQPFPPGDSKALINGHPNTPQPHPSQIPSSPVSPSKPQSPLTTPATSPKSLNSTVNNHSTPPPAIVNTTSPAPDSPPSTDKPVNLSLFQRIASYYKPTNRFEPLAIIVTIGIILGFLIGLMAVLKSVAHKKRFANKKDYPTGFPWVEPGSKIKRSSTRQGLVSTPSCMSARNSMTSSLHFNNVARRDTEDQITSPHVEYQLNELGVDVYSDYAWASAPHDLEKNPPSLSDEGPSSASTEESSHTPSTQEHGQWHAQSTNDVTCFVRGSKGEILEDSKVFTIGHS